MGKRPSAYQSPKARGLRRVTLLVPESCAMGVRDLARVLRTQQRHRPAGPSLGWRRLHLGRDLRSRVSNTGDWNARGIATGCGRLSQMSRPNIPH
jgi:hypothetical protein